MHPCLLVTPGGFVLGCNHRRMPPPALYASTE